VTQLPRVSGREVTAALSKMGYEKDRQRGSHIVMRQIVHPHRRITVPDHREIATGTLRAIIKQAGLTTEEFKQLL
jgi:predicted RNA binding protein YcfA (HicA-like mRNA interferase family)